MWGKCLIMCYKQQVVTTYEKCILSHKVCSFAVLLQSMHHGKKINHLEFCKKSPIQRVPRKTIQRKNFGRQVQCWAKNKIWICYISTKKELNHTGSPQGKVYIKVEWKRHRCSKVSHEVHKVCLPDLKFGVWCTVSPHKIKKSSVSWINTLPLHSVCSNTILSEISTRRKNFRQDIVTLCTANFSISTNEVIFCKQ